MKKTKEAFVFALHGLKYAFLKERNFRTEIFFALLACITAYLLHISAIEWFIIMLNIGFVLCVELVNTAIEKVCDVVCKEINPAIKIIKDVAASAVVVAGTTAFVCGLLIFIPAFYKLLSQ